MVDEKAVSVIQQGFNGVGAASPTRPAKNDGDEAAAISYGGGIDTITRSIGQAGFQSIHRWVTEKHGVPAPLGNAVVGIRLFLGDLDHLRELPDECARQLGDIQRGSIEIVVRQTVDIAVMGVVQIEAQSRIVHQCDETRLAAAHRLGEGDRRIVPRINQ